MKTVYFVRHGETPFNAENRFNTPDAPLSEKGLRQARDIAKRVSSLPIEIVVASTLKRAQQTATIISETVGKKFLSSDLFAEGRYTSRLDGMPVKDPAAALIIKEYFDHFGEPEYRFEDGQNFDDLKKRALAAFSYLESLPEEHILVVSHALFLWMVAATAIFGENLTAPECLGILGGLELMENSAITILTFDAPIKKAAGEPVSRWQIKVWNDHAHLG